MGKASIILLTACSCLLALAQLGSSETMWYRPDGTPVRVSYFTDGYGYRPRAKADYTYSAPTYSSGRSYNDLDVRSDRENLALGNNNGGATAIAQPSVNAYVGYNGRAAITPEAVALSGNGGGYYSRSTGQYYNGGTAIAKPSVYAQVGDQGSLTVSPRAVAATGDATGSYTPSGRYYNRVYY